MSISAATGTPLFGVFQVERGRVAYFYAEDGETQGQNRIRAELAGRDMELAGGGFFPQPRGTFIDVTRDEDLALIVASCRSLGKLDLLVLDPLRDISSAAEDKSDEMSPVMRKLRLLGEILDCTVLVVHHTAKITQNTAGRRPGQRLRGSSAIHGSIDSGIYLSDLGGNGVSVFQCVVTSEIKGARSAGKFALQLSIEDDENGEAVRASWLVDTGGDRRQPAPGPAPAQIGEDSARVLAKIVEKVAAGQSSTATSLRHDLGWGAARVNRALDQLVATGRVVTETVTRTENGKQQTREIYLVNP